MCISTAKLVTFIFENEKLVDRLILNVHLNILAPDGKVRMHWLPDVALTSKNTTNPRILVLAREVPITSDCKN